MISLTSRYAFHILSFLLKTTDRLVPGEEIATATGVPANYLSKILSQLRKHGLVESQKGWGGGFRLRDDSGDRPLCDVLKAIDGDEHTHRTDCAFGLPACNPDDPCPLHPWWEQMRTIYEDGITITRISDLANRA